MPVISIHDNIYLPGEESNTSFEGLVITEVVRGQTNPEIIVMHVPHHMISQVKEDAFLNFKTTGRRITVTTGGHTDRIRIIGSIVHWVDYSKWKLYLKSLHEGDPRR
jgi:hypothetical protein